MHVILFFLMDVKASEHISFANRLVILYISNARIVNCHYSAVKANRHIYGFHGDENKIAINYYFSRVQKKSRIISK